MNQEALLETIRTGNLNSVLKLHSPNAGDAIRIHYSNKPLPLVESESCGRLTIRSVESYEIMLNVSGVIEPPWVSEVSTEEIVSDPNDSKIFTIDFVTNP